MARRFFGTCLTIWLLGLASMAVNRHSPGAVIVTGLGLLFTIPPLLLLAFLTRKREKVGGSAAKGDGLSAAGPTRSAAKIVGPTRSGGSAAKGEHTPTREKVKS